MTPIPEANHQALCQHWLCPWSLLGHRPSANTRSRHRHATARSRQARTIPAGYSINQSEQTNDKLHEKRRKHLVIREHVIRGDVRLFLMGTKAQDESHVMVPDFQEHHAIAHEPLLRIVGPLAATTGRRLDVGQV